MKNISYNEGILNTNLPFSSAARMQMKFNSQLNSITSIAEELTNNIKKKSVGKRKSKSNIIKKRKVKISSIEEELNKINFQHPLKREGSVSLQQPAQQQHNTQLISQANNLLKMSATIDCVPQNQQQKSIYTQKRNSMITQKENIQNYSYKEEQQQISQQQQTIINQEALKASDATQQKQKRIEKHVEKYLKKIGIFQKKDNKAQITVNNDHKDGDDPEPKLIQRNLKSITIEKQQQPPLPKLKQKIQPFNEDNDVDNLINFCDDEQHKLNQLDHKYFKNMKQQDRVFKKLNKEFEKMELENIMMEGDDDNSLLPYIKEYQQSQRKTIQKKKNI